MEEEPRALPSEGGNVGAAPARPARRSRRRVAAIDIGSNSIRQIVADVTSNGNIRVVDDMKSAPRLGVGLEQSGRLATEAVHRSTEAIARMATVARRLGARKIEVVATSAVRDADNAAEFVTTVYKATGLRPRVLTGEEEARLSFRSALAHFDLGVGRTAVVDIGGGSLELCLAAEGLVDRFVSLPFGTLRLTERYLTEQCRRKDVRTLRKNVRAELRRHLPARDWRRAQVIGSGGTFTNLAGMALARAGMSRAPALQGTRVARAEIEHILDALQDTSLAERRRVPGLNAARADIIVAGLAVVAEVMARLEANELVVSQYGIREGLLLETARVEPVVAVPGDARQRSVMRLAEQCRFDEKHSAQVQRLALQLFDALHARIGATQRDRQTLADAALLHDIGYHISYEKHHKHSYYLIQHAELLGMSPAEREVVANVARYHRGAEPSRKHRAYAELDPELRGTVRRLSALLRVADGLDRGHAQQVRRVRVRVTERAIRLTPVATHTDQPLRLELWGGARKAELLAKVTGVPVELVDSVGEVASSTAHRGDRD